MNYSNDSRKKVEQKNNSNASQIKKKGKVSVFRVIIICLIIGMFSTVGAGLGVVIGIIKSSPDPSTINIKPSLNAASYVYDDQGTEIASFTPAENREYATLDQIPLNLQHAVVATEDERFYKHNGIDIKGIFRALANNVRNKRFSEGASTITQQLLKNNVLTSDKKLTRKIQEQYLAVQIEKRYSKNEILEYYLNTIGLSQGVSGVQAAARRYFNKDVSKLSLTECVVLAVITQRPSYYDPIKNQKNNWEKVQVVLNKMEQQGYITSEEHANALLENPYDNIDAVHQNYLSNTTRSYFVDALFTQLKSDLMDKLGCSETDAKNMIYGGGLKIHSTQNTAMQNIADKYIQDSSQYPSSLYKVQVDYTIAGKKADGTPIDEHVYNVILGDDSEVQPYVDKKKAEWGITSEDTITGENLIVQPQPQASFVLTDYTTGQIKVLCGGRDYNNKKQANQTFNYVTQAKRQPGSTFKVLAAYAPALDNGLLGPDSTLKNERVSYKIAGSAPYSPKNWDNNYSGTYTVREAIANSMNVLAVKTAVDIVGIDTSYSYLTNNFGFTTLSETDKVLSLPLGGITDGVTPLELNAAYGAIANDGIYVKPVYYTKVESADGQVLIDNTGANIAENSHAAIKEDTAHMLTNIMQEVVDGPSKHTGGKIRSYFPKSAMPVAGKTGTTTDNVDLLFAGYTPYYAATIWTGYSISGNLNGANNYHLKLWGEIMNEIHKNLPYKEFPKASAHSSSNSNEMVSVKFCTESGKLATDACEAAGTTETKMMRKSEIPDEYCDIHQIIRICKASGKLATDNCPADQVYTEVKIKGQSSGPTEKCDIHFASDPDVSPDTPPANDISDNPPADSSTDSGTESPSVPSNPEPKPSTPPSSNTTPAEPSTPPPVESTPPNPDDNDNFVIPQN